MPFPDPPPYSPALPTSPTGPTPSFGRSLSRSLSRSLTSIRLQPLRSSTQPIAQATITDLPLELPSNYDIDYPDEDPDEDEYEWAENEGIEVVENQRPTAVGTIPEEDENENEDEIRPISVRQPSLFQWRAVPQRKPVSLRRNQTTLSRRRTGTIRRKPSRAATVVEDPNLVTWKGDDDPLNPLNWPKNKKWISTLLVSSFTFISPIASTMVAPALEDIAEEFEIKTSVEKVLVMSIFLLAYAVGPFLLGPLSEVFGRVVVLQAANGFFLLFNFACGFAKTKSQMMAFRFLSGLGGSAPQAIGGGVLSDCWRADERGTALAIYSLAPFLGPAVGPIAGGYITQYTTWRWVFWATSIADLLVQILATLFLAETYHPAILAKICENLKKETGNDQLHTKWQGGPDKTIPALLRKAMVRPFIMLFTQPALQAMAIYRAYGYGIMYLVFSTFPMVFEEQYDLEPGPASLNYISLGVGFVAGLQISGPLQDRLYKYQKRNAIDPSASLRTYYHSLRHHPSSVGDPESIEPLTPSTNARPTLKRIPTKFDPAQGVPEHRLPLCLPFGLLIPLGLLIYGLTAQAKTHWIAPNIGAAILCVGLIITFNCAQAYVVDTYTNHATGVNYAASATGASAFVRTMAGFSFPFFGPGLYEKLGVGGGNGVLAAVALVLGVLAPVGLWRWGAWLRARSTYCT